MYIDDDNQSMDTYKTMVCDAFGHSQTTNTDPLVNGPPNPKAQNFYDMLDATKDQFGVAVA